MMSLFRVRAATVSGTELVCETCESRGDAEALFRSLQSEGSVLEGAGAGAVVIELLEMCNGTWTVASRKLAVIG